MLGFLKNFKNKKVEEESIYKLILKAQEENKLQELNLKNYLIKAEDDNIDGLKEALLSYYNKDKNSLNKFVEYFKNHKAEEIFEKFEIFLFSMDVFYEQKLAGLSILLMRDTSSIEAIRFGILLGELYQLENVSGAIRIITDLGAREEFTYYSLRVLKNLRLYPLLRDNIIRRGNDEVKKIEEKIK
ncbi:MAG: hypothetical protein ACTHWZ_07375 [Peptoniphilaceae bacterium]